MTEFGAAATLQVSVDEGSLRSARRQIQEGVEPVQVEAVASNQPSRQISQRQRRADGGVPGASLSGSFDSMQELDMEQNELLRETLDELEMGNRIMSQLGGMGGAGSGLLGLLGLGGDVGTEIGGTVAEAVASGVGSAVGTAVGNALTGSSVSVEDTEPLTVKEPEWQPIAVEDPGTVGVEEPGEVGVEDPGALEVSDNRLPLEISNERLPLQVDAPESIPLDVSGVGFSMTMTTTTSMTLPGGGAPSGPDRPTADRGGPLSFLFGASPSRGLEKIPFVGGRLAKGERNATRNVYKDFGRDPNRVEPLSGGDAPSARKNRSTTRSDRRETTVTIEVDARGTRDSKEVRRKVEQKLPELERRLKEIEQIGRGGGGLLR